MTGVVTIVPAAAAAEDVLLLFECATSIAAFCLYKFCCFPDFLAISSTFVIAFTMLRFLITFIFHVCIEDARVV